MTQGIKVMSLYGKGPSAFMADVHKVSTLMNYERSEAGKTDRRFGISDGEHLTKCQNGYFQRRYERDGRKPKRIRVKSTVEKSIIASHNKVQAVKKKNADQFRRKWESMGFDSANDYMAYIRGRNN